MTILYASLERSALRESFEAEPDGDSLRLGTDIDFNLGAELVVDVVVPDSGVHVLLSGYVSRAVAQPPGSAHPWEVVVTYFEREAHKNAYLKQIALAEEPATERRATRRLPVKLNARWRPHKTGAWLQGSIDDISSGGAFVRTDAPSSVGLKALFEIEVLGLESTVQIAGKVVHSRQGGSETGWPGGMGVQFVWRDRGGLVRLRELLRRIEAPLSSEPLGGIGEPDSDFDEEVLTQVEPTDTNGD